MKVRELIEFLELSDPEAEVVLAEDEEGNGYVPCDAYEDGLVYHEGEVAYAELDADLEAAGYGPEDCWDPEDGEATPCVVLWP